MTTRYADCLPAGHQLGPAGSWSAYVTVLDYMEDTSKSLPRRLRDPLCTSLPSWHFPATTWIKHARSAAPNTEIATPRPYEINACAIERTKVPTYHCPNSCYFRAKLDIPEGLLTSRIRNNYHITLSRGAKFNRGGHVRGSQRQEVGTPANPGIKAQRREIAQAIVRLTRLRTAG